MQKVCKTAKNEQKMQNLTSRAAKFYWARTRLQMHIFPLAFSVQLEFTAIEPNFPDLVLTFPDTKYIRVPAHFGRGAKITTRCLVDAYVISPH